MVNEDDLSAAERAAAAVSQQSWSPPRWEYQVKTIPKLFGSGKAEKMLAEVGAQGWELVSADNERLIFKRPLPPR